MTPAEVRALSASEYIGFSDYMDRDLREQRRQAKARAKGKR